MPFSPRTPDEIRQALLAFLVSVGVIVPVNEGDAASTLLAAYAEDMASFEAKLLAFVNGYFLAVDGDLLDDRIAQIPGVNPRRQNVPARGGGVTLRRTDTDAIVYPAGSIQISDALRQNIRYTNRYPVEFGLGVTQVTDQHFVATSPGIESDAPAGTQRLVVRGNGITSCTNTEAFTGGLDRERDGDYRARARAFLLTLARSQADALEGLALNFTDSTGAGVLHAKAVEFADRGRGFTQLVVSDGAGMPASRRRAISTTGVFPTLTSGTRHTLHFDHPAASRLKVVIGGVEYLTPQSWLAAIDEKGVAWVQEDVPFIAPGGTWLIHKHNVYIGWIKEFQEYVNKTCVAAGTRVQVIPPVVQLVDISANCIVAGGTRPIAPVFAAVRRAIVEFFEYIGPGEFAYIHKLHERVAKVPGVVNIIFDQTDFTPGSDTTKLVAQASRIKLR